MKALRLPRFVLVFRQTSLELLLARHGTLSQARFYLEGRGQRLDEHERSHRLFTEAIAQVDSTLPPDRRRTRVLRDELDRFLFAPDDVVIAVGQDGLVANVAKYLAGQLVLGVNPDPESYDGILCPHPPTSTAAFVAWLDDQDSRFLVEQRTMVAVEREDGQRLLALNEVFIGHRTHQSARYRLAARGREERQSSSGILCTSGTGATGWARSIARQRGLSDLPAPEDGHLAWMVREPFPSVATGTELDFGTLPPGESLEVISEMAQDGVVFGDGIEADRLEFVTGQRLRLQAADHRLRLVVAARPAE